MRRFATTKYEPPSIPPRTTVAIMLVFVTLTMVRGYGWLTIVPGTVPDQLLDNHFGLTRWGALLLLGGAGLWTTVVLDRHFPVWCAHGFLASVYFGIFITVLPSAWVYGGGWQNLVPPLGGLAWHGLLSRLMGPLPRRERTATTDAD